MISVGKVIKASSDSEIVSLDVLCTLVRLYCEICNVIIVISITVLL